MRRFAQQIEDLSGINIQDSQKKAIISDLISEAELLATSTVVLSLAFKTLDFKWLKTLKPVAFVGLSSAILLQLLNDLKEANRLIKRIDGKSLNAFVQVMGGTGYGVAAGRALAKGENLWDAMWEKAVEIGASPNYEAIPDLITKTLSAIENIAMILMSPPINIPVPGGWFALIAIIKRIFTTKNAKDFAAFVSGSGTMENVEGIAPSAKQPAIYYRVLEIYREGPNKYSAVKLIDSFGNQSEVLWPGLNGYDKWKDVKVLSISGPNIVNSKYKEFIIKIKRSNGNIDDLNYRAPFINNDYRFATEENFNIEQFVGQNNYTKLINSLIDDYLFKNKNENKEIKMNEFINFVLNHPIKNEFTWIGKTSSPSYNTFLSLLSPAISLHNQSLKTNYRREGKQIITNQMILDYQNKWLRGNSKPNVKKLETIQALEKGTQRQIDWTGWSELGKIAIQKAAYDEYKAAQDAKAGQSFPR